MNNLVNHTPFSLFEMHGFKCVILEIHYSPNIASHEIKINIQIYVTNHPNVGDVSL